VLPELMQTGPKKKKKKKKDQNTNLDCGNHGYLFFPVN
jgi:hypothetical protein